MAAKAASAKGDGYMTEANSILNKKSVFGSFFGKSSRYEEAADLFEKAGNSYKLANQWQSAGDAYMLAARNIRLSEMPGDAPNMFVKAAECYKKINPHDAISALTEAINLYNDAGRFDASAKNYKEIAELYEHERNIDSAVENYQSAADLFNGNNKKQNAKDCLLKIAILVSEQGDYHKAAVIFENAGREAMESNLGKFSAKGYLFQSLLCLLALGDSVAVRNKLDAFKTIDHTFGSSRECGFIEKLLAATDKMSGDEFGDACSDFDKISPLDPWKVSVLSAAKTHITSENDGEVDLA